VFGEGAPVSTASLQQLGRELVQRPRGQPRHVADALSGTEGQQDALQRVAVGLVDRVGREAASSAVGQVVLDQSLQRRGRLRIHDLEVGHGSSLISPGCLSDFVAEVTAL
jgi:hypothetical protein